MVVDDMQAGKALLGGWQVLYSVSTRFFLGLEADGSSDVGLRQVRRQPPRQAGRVPSLISANSWSSPGILGSWILHPVAEAGTGIYRLGAHALLSGDERQEYCGYLPVVGICSCFRGQDAGKRSG